jgi:hypothetical protein
MGQFVRGMAFNREFFGLAQLGVFSSRLGFVMRRAGVSM